MVVQLRFLWNKNVTVIFKKGQFWTTATKIAVRRGNHQQTSFSVKWVCVVKLNDSNGFCPSSQHPQSNIRHTVNLSNVTESCCCSVVSAAVVYDACYKCIVSGLSMPCGFHTRLKMASDVCTRAVSFQLIQ